MSDETPKGPGPKGPKKGGAKKSGKRVNADKPRARARTSPAPRNFRQVPVDLDRSASGKVRTLHEIERAARMAALLDRLADTGEEITPAATALGIPRAVLWEWRKKHPDFDQELAEAYRVGTESLAAVARSRAVDGWDEPVFWQGQQIGTIRKYDHNLLQFIMRKRDVSYRDATLGKPVTPPRSRGELTIDTDGMPADLLDKLEAWAEKKRAA